MCLYGAVSIATAEFVNMEDFLIGDRFNSWNDFDSKLERVHSDFALQYPMSCT